MNLSGIQGLASMAVIVLLVSGCSTQSKPDYDPLEVIEYQTCLDAQLESREWERIPDERTEQVLDYILDFCKTYKPRKQG